MYTIDLFQYKSQFYYVFKVSPGKQGSPIIFCVRAFGFRNFIDVFTKSRFLTRPSSSLLKMKRKGSTKMSVKLYRINRPHTHQRIIFIKFLIFLATIRLAMSVPTATVKWCPHRRSHELVTTDAQWSLYSYYLLLIQWENHEIRLALKHDFVASIR
jgi:hypothetical protein